MTVFGRSDGRTARSTAYGSIGSASPTVLSKWLPPASSCCDEAELDSTFDHPQRFAGESVAPCERGDGSWSRRKILLCVVSLCGLGLCASAMVRTSLVITEASNKSGVLRDENAVLQELPRGVAVDSTWTSKHYGNPNVPAEDRSAPLSPLEFTALNFYHKRDGKPGQDYPWLKDIKLIEPHRETTLAVVNPREGFEYNWKIWPLESSRRESGATIEVSGAEVLVVIRTLDKHVVNLEEVNVSSKRVTKGLEEGVMIKYVRREIRTITEEEREELLDAMHTLWTVTVDDGNGREIYGEGYADIWAISRLHLKGGVGTTGCDRFHDGIGFLTSHTLATNTFEFSLQRINPKLTVPYWDFTIESSSEGSEGYDVDRPETKSPLLQSSWFGSSDPDDNVVKDGRWAFTKIPTVRDNNPGGLKTNVYSFLRAPWNMNNRPYLTRGINQNCQIQMENVGQWPTCSKHYDAVTSFDRFNAWAWSISGASHGPLHFWLGGIMDCKGMFADIANLVGPDAATALAKKTTAHRKGMYCDGIFKCREEHVAAEVQPKEVIDSGICGCLDYDLTHGDDYLTVMHSLESVEDTIGGFDADTQRQVVSLLCSGVMSYGENAEAASPIDPTFWPIHPTLERLYQFSVLTDTFSSTSWPDETQDVVAPDGTLYTEILSLGGDSCPGHRGSDVFPFGLLENETNGFKIRNGVSATPAAEGNRLTNREMLEALDPRASSMSYIYDNFAWDHCKIDGYDFHALLRRPEAE